jgi:predicted ATPase
VRITRVKIRNWRNFTQAEVMLDQRAFLIGPNASGKSNFFEALKFLRDLVAVGGGLQEAARLRGGLGEIRSFAARSKPNVSLEIDIGDDDDLTSWTYALEISTPERSKEVVVVSERVTKSGRTQPVLNRPDKDDKADPARLSQTALEQVNSNQSFREVAEFLASIRYLHVVPQIMKEPMRSAGSNDAYGGDLIERINATSRKTRDARLKRMEEALRVAVPQLSQLELEIDDRGTPHLRAKYKHWRPQGAWQRENRFSDGTLRLLGLIWALQEPGGPLLLEEPEMSLNPGVVSKLAPMIARASRRSKRQVLVTTHSSDLLSDGVSLSEVHLLRPTDEGTVIESEAQLDDVRQLLDGGVPLGEAIMPKARAKDADRLPLLDLMTQ